MGLLGNLFHPERFQGRGRKRPYFEGWYYKLVDASTRHRYAVIPGIYRGPSQEDDHCFVQFMDGLSGQVTYYRYAADAFSASSDALDVQVGPSRFLRDGMLLELDAPDQRVRGEVRFEDVKPWPVTLRSPGIMGWYAYVPLMQCYHGVVSLDHRLVGALRVDSTLVDLTGGRGYTEKDWGTTFPAAWIWFQSNHLGQEGSSVTASVAVIPWLWTSFPGFIMGILHEGKLHRFATYTGAHMDQLSVDQDSIVWVVSDGAYRLSLSIERTAAAQLYAPDIRDMSARVGETIQARADVHLEALEQGIDGKAHSVFRGSTKVGALEVVGDVSRLSPGES